MSQRRVAGARVAPGDEGDPQMGKLETVNSGSVPGRMIFSPQQRLVLPEMHKPSISSCRVAEQ
jgi:hypothetical protein